MSRRDVRVDLDALRALVSVAAVLRAHDVAVERDTGRCACPLHGGGNPSAFSYEPRRWHCFGCGAGGDVFALVAALRRCAFRRALAVVAGLAGVAVDGLPRIDRAELARRQTIARRLAKLRRWRGEQLRIWGCRIGDLEREARALGIHFGLPEHRDHPARWIVLESVHADLIEAEQMAAEFGVDDVEAWADLWKDWHRSQAIAPRVAAT